MIDLQDIASYQFPRKIEQKYSSSEYSGMVEEYKVPNGKAAIWHLGQNSFIVKSSETTCIIDPYLSDFSATGYKGGKSERSRILPVMIQPEHLDADYILITHSHSDHTDPLTIKKLKAAEHAEFICSYQASALISEMGIPDERITRCSPTEMLERKGLSITGTFALPTDTSDLNHMGFLLKFDNGPVYWNSGDSAPTPLLKYMSGEKIDMATICINAGYHNLSFYEAAEIIAEVKPGLAAPSHYDVMPHNITPPHLFLTALEKMSPEQKAIVLPYYEPTIF